MFGQDRYKKFNNDVAKLLQQHKEDAGNSPVLSEAQIEGANAAKKELAEKKMYTLETRNAVIKKHLFETSKGLKVTSDMIKAFNALVLGG